MLEMREDNTACCAFVGETPWHNLGTKVDPNLTPVQMLEAAGLDWSVSKEQTYLNWAQNDGELTPVPDTFALVRSSDRKILDVVSGDWNEVQNLEAFEFFNDFVLAGDMEMHTAGSLCGGEIVWALAKVKETFEVTPGDTVDSYLLFTNYHKYGCSTDIRFSPIRTVCWNTLQLSLNKKAERSVKVSHRKVFDGDQVKLILGVAAEKLAKYREVSQFLAGHRYTEEQAVEYAMRVFPLAEESKKDISKNALRLLEVVDEQPGSEFSKESFWNLYNGVSYLTDHELGRSQDTRLRSAWYGGNADLKVKALELAVEMAE